MNHIDWWSKYEKAQSDLLKGEEGREQTQENEEIISPIKIYPCELEKVDEFKDLINIFKKFDLLKGKCRVNCEQEVQCQFKGIENNFIKFNLIDIFFLNNIKRTSVHSLQGVLILKFYFKNFNFNN